MRFSSTLALIFTFLTVTSLAMGQATSSGNIAGVVTDTSGAAIANATVTATNKANNAQRVTSTGTAGEYRFDLLPAAQYTVGVMATGFSPSTTQVLDLQVGASVQANIVIKPGSVSTVVEVAMTNQLVDSEKTDSSTNVTPQEIQDLPLNGRDFANLAILAPGVKLVDSYDPTKNRYAVYAVNGSSGRNTNTTVNGVDNKDNTVGGAVMQLPLEAVEEFKISAARFSAENGRSEGAAINVITKSGTNKFHGSLYGFFRNDIFEKKNALDIAANNPKPSYSRQQYGGSFGGPILRDKAFGFFAYEGLRERSSLSVDAETQAELALAVPLGAVPVASIATPFDEKRYNGRIDYQVNEKNHVYGSYTAQDNKSLNDQSTNQVDSTEGNFTINDLILANLTLSTVLSNKSMNNFTAGFQYWNNLIDSKTRTPYFTFPDGTSFGTNPNVPQKSSQHKFQFRDDFSYSVGKHTLKTGVDYLYEPQVGGFFENNPTPEFDFFDTAANLLDTSKYPNGFSSPGVIQGSTGTAGDPSFNLSPSMIGVYFQDDWHASRRLLLNLGIRYDKDIDTYGIGKQANSRTHQELIAAAATGIATVPADRSNEAGFSYIPSTGYIGGTYTGLPHNDNKDISPRIGLSYDVFGNSRLVLRGGYGLYFGQTFENIPLFMIQQSNALVFANTYSISCAGPTATGCDPVPGTGIPLNEYRYGIDPLPVIPPASAQLTPGSTGRLMDPHFRNPYTQQINVGLQYALTKSSVLEVEYVQARGLHEDKTVNSNPKEYFLAGAPRPFSAAFAAAGVPVLGRIGLEASIGRSYYDGLNVSYRANVAKRFSINTNYTYSKALAFEGNPAAFRNTATNPFLGQLRRPDFGRAPNDETHHITAGGTVTLPFKIDISPIFQAGTARSVDIVESSSDLWGVGSGRSNPHAALFAGQTKSVANFTNFYQAAKASGSVSTFYQTCLAAGACYETSYDTLSGDAFIELDARISKTVTIKDRYNVNVFFQGFNLTNRANYGGNYDGNISDYTAGSTKLTPLGFVNPGSTLLPRAFTGEFGARFSF
ncbi:outer membrane receptor protein involved in Fe transport [Granulicella aggregans]|uniref:Outer membrane receptor protein involved in Fe transport n=1 Tax=Granulicella aggregans TaxID=474949 RepID=A0A7W7ZII8_9BACT|nr:TonB-dependent receptor [Granulicella aggregans]MBB5060164.1 outer membrane receptor protein involved in Fe transport [Granulicella aggregans]